MLLELLWYLVSFFLDFRTQSGPFLMELSIFETSGLRTDCKVAYVVEYWQLNREVPGLNPSRACNVLQMIDNWAVDLKAPALSPIKASNEVVMIEHHTLN